MGLDRRTVGGVGALGPVNAGLGRWHLGSIEGVGGIWISEDL